jgi:hypothetical protein
MLLKLGKFNRKGVYAGMKRFCSIVAALLAWAALYWGLVVSLL